LHDPQGILAQLKASINSLSAIAQESDGQQFLWAVEFDLEQAKKFAEQGDVYNATGCLARCASALVQVVYALNERYFVNDKGSMRGISSFGLKPADFALVS